MDIKEYKALIKKATSKAVRNANYLRRSHMALGRRIL